LGPLEKPKKSENLSALKKKEEEFEIPESSTEYKGDGIK
jgi:hypothetical protein